MKFGLRIIGRCNHVINDSECAHRVNVYSGWGGDMGVDAMRKLYSYHELEYLFERRLYYVHGSYKVAGIEYEAAHILKCVDRVHFDAECREWILKAYDELGVDDLTAEEVKHYGVSSQLMYAGKWGDEG